MAAVIGLALLSAVALSPLVDSEEVREPRVWLDQVELPESAPPVIVPEPRVLRSFTAEVSGYCLRGTTASGVPVQAGVVAAAPSLAFGTRLQIDGIGPAIVLDRGGAISGNRLDVWFSDCGAARRWGRQYRRVEVIE